MNNTAENLPNEHWCLSLYGYNTKKSEHERRNALDEVCQNHGVLPVLRRANLLRNYQIIAENKNILSADIEYLKKKLN